MAHTELILRLLKDGKIVGYEWHFNGKIRYHFNINLVTCGLSFCIDHDSFELGIMIGDKWLFDGDLLDYGDGLPRKLHLSIDCLGDLSHAICVGNVHDSPEYLEEK